MAKGNFGKKGHHENWTKLGIRALKGGAIDNIKMTEEQARRTFDNAYRKALRQAKASGDTINVAREVYYSMFARGTQRFDIKLKASDFTGDGVSTSSSVSSKYTAPTEITIDNKVYKQSIEKQYVADRLEKLAENYEKVDKLLKQYQKGRISLDTLNKRIKKFKETDDSYLKRNAYKE